MQRSCVRRVGVAQVHYIQLFTLKIEGISVEDLRHDQLGRNLTRKPRLPKGTYYVRLDLLLHGRNNGRGGKRFCVGKPVQQEVQAEEMVAMGMSDVNGCEILASLDEPIY